MEKKNNKIIWIYKQSQYDYGFVDVEDREKWYFIFPTNSSNALDGDEVLAEINIFRWREEAKIKKILKRSENTIIWTLKHNNTFWFVVPDRDKYKNDIFISGKNLKWYKDWDKVWVKITKWNSKNPEGEIVDIIKWENPTKEAILGMIIESGTRYKFNHKIEKELENFSNDISDKDLKERKNLKKLFTITIDWKDAKDLDDAISLQKLDKWNFLLYVHIADVSNYIKEGSEIDKEALKRTTSVYLTDRVIPMLPEKISNWLCSLNPNEAKLTLTAQIELNKKWHIINTKVYESIIESNYRITYDEVYGIIEHKDELKFRKEESEITSYKSLEDEIIQTEVKRKELQNINNNNQENINLEISPTTIKRAKKITFGWKITNELINFLENAEELRQIISKNKKELWVLDFDFPEIKIILDHTKQNIKDIKKIHRNIAHRMIEEFMIIANEAVSRKFTNIPFLYRIHENPSEKDRQTLNKILQVYNYNISKETISTKSLALVLDEIKNNTRSTLISKLILRNLSKAIYSEENKWHFWLGLKFYSHFTSPIRRYSDLQIHRIIKEKIKWRLDKKRLNHYKNILKKVSKDCSEKERKAEKLEYDVQDYYKALYMQDKIWQKYTGKISGIISQWFFVELDNSIEWMVRLDSIKWDYFDYDESMMTLLSPKSGKRYEIWDELKIEVIWVDLNRRKIDFSIL